MACCALAAFLIGQFLLLRGRLRARLQNDTPVTINAAAWRYGDPAPQQPIRNRKRLRLGTLLVGLGIAGLVGTGYAASQPQRVEIGDTGIMVTLCGGETAFSVKRMFGSF